MAFCNDPDSTASFIAALVGESGLHSDAVEASCSPGTRRLEGRQLQAGQTVTFDYIITIIVDTKEAAESFGTVLLASLKKVTGASLTTAMVSKLTALKVAKNEPVPILTVKALVVPEKIEVKEAPWEENTQWRGSSTTTTTAEDTGDEESGSVRKSAIFAAGLAAMLLQM